MARYQHGILEIRTYAGMPLSMSWEVAGNKKQELFAFGAGQDQEKVAEPLELGRERFEAIRSAHLAGLGEEGWQLIAGTQFKDNHTDLYFRRKVV